MCGRYTQTAAFDELALRFGITVEDAALEDLPPRYNVAPSQAVPIVIARDGGEAKKTSGRSGAVSVPSESETRSRLLR